jgi:hypothetical protein
MSGPALGALDNEPRGGGAVDLSAVVVASAAPSKDLEDLLGELTEALGGLAVRSEVLLVSYRPGRDLSRLPRLLAPGL